VAAARRRLFNYLVRSGDKRRGRVEPKRPGSLQVNDHLEFIGLIDRDIARLGPVEDLVHVTGKTLGEFAGLRRVAYQSPRST
jgi:hypothetical protein